MQIPISHTANQPTPVGEETMTSVGLCPTPLAVCSTNHGSSQPSSISSAPAPSSSQSTAPLSTTRVCAAVSGRSTRACGSAMSGTVGHPHAEQSAGPQHQHGDEHGEDHRVAPLPAEQLRAEDADHADH